MDVKVNIKTRQYDNNGSLDTIDVVAFGTLYNKKDDVYVVYKEKEDQLETTTTIKISKDEVSIKRYGSNNSTMIFKQDQSNITKYRTQQGLFIIETHTKNLDINFKGNNNIRLSIKYNIKIMDLFEGINQIDIQIEEKNNICC